MMLLGVIAKLLFIVLVVAGLFLPLITWVERKQSAVMQDRIGANRADLWGLTLIGLLINIFAAILFAKGLFFWAGLVIIFAGIFDIVDGEVARRTGRVDLLCT